MLTLTRKSLTSVVSVMIILSMSLLYVGLVPVLGQGMTSISLKLNVTNNSNADQQVSLKLNSAGSQGSSQSSSQQSNSIGVAAHDKASSSIQMSSSSTIEGSANFSLCSSSRCINLDPNRVSSAKELNVTINADGSISV